MMNGLTIATHAEYRGVCDGLDMLVNHLEELEGINNG